MAKVKSQNRIQIPGEIMKLVPIAQGDVGIYWDKEENEIFINSLTEREDKYCVAVRRLDYKNRIMLSQDILGLIGATTSSELVIAAKKQQIYIFKA